MTTTDTTALTDSIATAKQQEIEMLKAMPIDELIDTAVSGMVHFAINLAIAILVFYIGKFIIRRIYNITLAIFIRRQVDRSIGTFILSVMRMVMYFILIVIVIGILGIETTSFIALFASAGVAIGMALSGTLQNFAGGVLILLLKPYKVGDYIEAQGYAGTVKEIQIFNTLITTPDNQSIIIPNGGLSTGSINNYSKEDYRRIDWKISIAYGDDVDVARKALLDMLLSDDRIVKKYIEDDRKKYPVAKATTDDQEAESQERPRRWWQRRRKSRAKQALEKWQAAKAAEIIARIPRTDRSPSVVLSSLADSCIIISARAWTRNASYWSVFYDINERIYKELPKHGINFPFPQMDIHITNNQQL